MVLLCLLIRLCSGVSVQGISVSVQVRFAAPQSLVCNDYHLSSWLSRTFIAFFVLLISLFVFKTFPAYYCCCSPFFILRILLSTLPASARLSVRTAFDLQGIPKRGTLIHCKPNCLGFGYPGIGDLPQFTVTYATKIHYHLRWIDSHPQLLSCAAAGSCNLALIRFISPTPRLECCCILHLSIVPGICAARRRPFFPSLPLLPVDQGHHESF